MPLPSISECYCETAGQVPVESIDWAARQVEVNAIPPDGLFDYANEPDPVAAAQADMVAGVYPRTGEPDYMTRDAAQAVLDAERAAVASHLVRNGRGLRCGSSGAVLDASIDVERVGVADGRGGTQIRVVATGSTVTCPECASPVRWLES